MTILLRILTLAILMALPLPAWAKPAVTDARLAILSASTRVILSLTAHTEYRIFTLADPFRVVIDLTEVDWAIPAGRKLRGSGLVETIRYGLFQPGTSRIVLDLAAPAEVARAQFVETSGGEPVRLLIDLLPIGEAQFRDRLQSAILASSDKAPLLVAGVRTASAGDESALARGARKPLIAIDPGHGGVDAGAPGKELAQLIRMMEQSHPALSATTASREASAAEIEIAGALDDPQFEISFEDIARADGGPQPRSLGSIFYSVEQSFPLGGKRTLRRKVAEAGLAEVTTERDQTLLDLTARMKTAFARHYLAIQAVRVIEDEGAILRDMNEIAQERYAQGLGRQQEAFEAEIELAKVEGALAGAERDRKVAIAQINSLIGRKLEGPLAPPAGLPPVPDSTRLDPASLVSLAESRNPALAASNAVIDGAKASRRLADKNWYPDLTLGVSLVDQDRDIAGYEARIGFNIPLQWGLRRAERGRAKANLAAARSRFQAARVELSVQIAEVAQNLRAASTREEAMRMAQLPRMREAVEAARLAYGVDQAEIGDVLGAIRRLKQAEIEHLGMLFEQQESLAELERLLGGPL